MSMRNIYRQIAKKHGVTVAEVKREMQAAIDFAYKNENKTDFQKLEQKKIDKKGETPTPEELTAYITKKILNKR